MYLPSFPGSGSHCSFSEDIALSKEFPFGAQEKKSFEFRASAFNMANRHLLGGLTTSITSASYGQFSNPQSNQPRNVEFSLRFKYGLPGRAVSGLPPRSG